MQRLRKAFWVWLMVWVMPLSALAASALPCVGGHGPAGGGQAMEGATMAPCHGEAAVIAADGAAQGHHCSACAACAVGAALLVTLPVFGITDVAALEAPPPLLPGSGLVISRLERPPRAYR